MKTFLYILIGAVAAFIIFKMVVPQKAATKSETSEDFKKVLNTPEAQNLLSSDEFASLLVTPEFLKLMRGIGSEYLKSITETL